MVQYGSNEVAFIGGRDSTNTRIAEIDIYNLETEMWSTGPELPADIESTSLMGCEKIENANTIVLGCGTKTGDQDGFTLWISPMISTLLNETVGVKAFLKS